MIWLSKWWKKTKPIEKFGVSTYAILRTWAHALSVYIRVKCEQYVCICVFEWILLLFTQLTHLYTHSPTHWIRLSGRYVCVLKAYQKKNTSVSRQLQVSDTIYCRCIECLRRWRAFGIKTRKKRFHSHTKCFSRVFSMNRFLTLVANLR